MPKTKTKPGPKPGPKKRDYHFVLTTEKQPSQKRSLADAFEKAAKDFEKKVKPNSPHTGIVSFTSYLIGNSPEVQSYLLCETGKEEEE